MRLSRIKTCRLKEIGAGISEQSLHNLVQMWRPSCISIGQGQLCPEECGERLQVTRQSIAVLCVSLSKDLQAGRRDWVLASVSSA